MDISREELDKLLNFKGYSNLDAPIWFLDMEEGTGGSNDPAAIEANIRTRAQHFQPVEDLVESHLHFGYDIPAQRKFTQVWLWMAKLVRGINGEPDWTDTEKAKHYVRTQLGRKDGDTFLTELLPLPAKGLAHWPYTALYSTRQEYYETVLPQRCALLMNLIEEHRPACVLAYGSGYHGYYRQVFKNCQWQRLNTRAQIGTCRTGTMGVALLPFFGNGALGTADAQIVIRYMRREDHDPDRPYP